MLHYAFRGGNMANGKMIMVNKKEIKEIIEKTIKESIKDGFFKIRLELIPEISDEEMKQIQRKYKKPSKKTAHSEWIDV